MLFGLGFFVKRISVYLFTEFIPVLSHLSFRELFGDIIYKSTEIQFLSMIFPIFKINAQLLNVRSMEKHIKPIHEGKNPFKCGL